MTFFTQLCLTVFTAIATTYGAYYFGKRSREENFQKTEQKNRYDTAYLKLIELLHVAFIAYQPHSERILESRYRTKIFDFVTYNLKHWGSSTFLLYEKFYKAELDMLEYENGNTVRRWLIHRDTPNKMQKIHANPSSSPPFSTHCRFLIYNVGKKNSVSFFLT